MKHTRAQDSKIDFIYWAISLVALTFIFAPTGTLSYFISPYFVPGYPKYLPGLAAFGITAAVIYLLGITFVLKEKSGRAENLVEKI